jgi:hypothetical protein
VSEDSNSKQEVDLAAIEARLKAATPDIADMTRVSKGATVGLDYVLDDGYNPILAPEAQKFVDHAPTDIAALLARARQQDVRIAELEVEMDRVKDKAAGVQMANKLLEFDKVGLKEEVERLREEKADLEQALYGDDY